MEALFFLLAFLLGFSAGALVVFLKGFKPQNRLTNEASEPYEDAELFSQYLNFMKYDGTQRGQKNE